MDSVVIDTDEQLQKTVAGFLSEPAALHRIVFSKPVQGKKAEIRKITVRPVRIGGKAMFQVSTYDEKKSIDANHDPDAAPAEMGRILGLGFRNVRNCDKII